jgi:hypothetical protein
MVIPTIMTATFARTPHDPSCRPGCPCAGRRSADALRESSLKTWPSGEDLWTVAGQDHDVTRLDAPVDLAPRSGSSSWTSTATAADELRGDLDQVGLVEGLVVGSVRGITPNRSQPPRAIKLLSSSRRLADLDDAELDRLPLRADSTTQLKRVGDGIGLGPPTQPATTSSSLPAS